ncbi:MAG: hypothetical protein EU548_00255 [Promethearchaeota archaeon]|nr:MAG: hypothetical protein EU548_00255 [Candidatus Lokiarchaeota archaeon]
MQNIKIKRFSVIVIIFLMIMQSYFVLFNFSYNNEDSIFHYNDNFETYTNSNDFNDLYFNKDPNYLPTRILTIVEDDKESYFDEFLYLNAISTSIFNFNNKTFLMPQIFSNPTEYKSYFLNDWYEFSNKWGGPEEIIYMGDLSSNTINTYNSYLNLDSKDNTLFNSSNLFDISSEIAKFYWYKSDTIIFALANSTFSNSNKIYINESGSLSLNQYNSITGNLTENQTSKIYDSSNLSLDTRALYFTINDSDNFGLDLLGNRSDGSTWMYDTNLNTKNSWVFFPNVSYPGNLSEWRLEINNRSKFVEKDYNITYVNFSYYEKPFSISDNYKEINIELNWSPIAGEDLDLWLLSPKGQLIDGPISHAFKQKLASNSESITVEYPGQGDWKVIITGNQNQSIDFNLSIVKEEENEYYLNSIESSANAAVLSSLINDPILYLDNFTLHNSIIDAIEFLNASKAIILSPRSEIPQNLFNELKQLGINEFQNLTSHTKIISKIKSISKEPDFIISSASNSNYAPATYLAAFHGAPLLLSNNASFNIHQPAIETYSQIEKTVFQDPYGQNSLEQELPIYNDMVNLSDVFYGWLESLNANYTQNKTVIIVESLDHLNPTFDRAIMGRSIVGRFGSEDRDENSISIMNNIFYPIFSFLNMTKIYAASNIQLSAEENTTISHYNVNAYNFSNDITATHSDDAIYHSFWNGSNGYISMPYSLNLSNYNIVIENITSINITVKGKINYSNSSVVEAGWGVMNWSSNQLISINDTFFNSTVDEIDSYEFLSSNLDSLINSTQDNRIEIFLFVNSTNRSISLDVNYINFNISYQKLLNQPNSLSSSISYYHNFTFQSNTYNFSELIPQNLSDYNFDNKNHTKTDTILTLLKNVDLWYYSGNFTLEGEPFSKNSSILFMNSDSWRGYNPGKTADNPDPENNHFVYPEESLTTWISNDEINNSLGNIHSKFILLQSSIAGSTNIPQTLLLHGATNVICNIRANNPGYSEYLLYETIQNLLTGINSSVGNSLLNALDKTSHLYSFNIKHELNEIDDFPNSTEDSIQYILFGDPELNIITKDTIELKPGSYPPLFHSVLNYTYRDRVEERQVKPFGEVKDGNGQLWASITDFDSDPFVLINITNTTLGENPMALLHDEQHNIVSFKQTSSGVLNQYGYSYNYKGITIFDVPYYVGFTRESLGWKSCEWIIYDFDANFSVEGSFYLRSNPPFLNYFGSITNDTRFLLNTTGSDDPYTFDNISHQVGNLHEDIWRVNNTFWTRLKVYKTDHNATKHINDELNVTLLVSQNYTLPMENWSEINISNETLPLPYNPYKDCYGLWNASFNFENNQTGKYWYGVILEDEYGMKTYYKDFDEWWFNVNNWEPEFNYQYGYPTRLNTTQLYRENETISINVSLFDRDGNPGVKNVSIIFEDEDGHTISHPMINDSLVRINWSANFTFSKYNQTGIWNLFFQIFDIDNESVVLNSSLVVNVTNWFPDHPFNLSLVNISSNHSQNYLYRNNSVLLLANATDMDTINRTQDLDLKAFIKAPNNTIYSFPMVYSKDYGLWAVNFTPETNYLLGNYTFFVGAIDNLGAMTNSTEKINVSIYNNLPQINYIQVCIGADKIPGDEMVAGVDLTIKGKVSDTEGLRNFTVFIEDDFDNQINKTIDLTGGVSEILIVFNESDYSALETDQKNNWTISCRLFDMDGIKSINFDLNNQSLNETIILIKPVTPETDYEFPTGLIIAIAIIIIIVIGTYLVYKNIRKKEVIVPSKDVKRIIKKISEEEEKGKEIKEEKKEEKEGKIAEKIKEEEEVPVKLSEDEVIEIEENIRDNLKTIKKAINKKQFKRAAELYRYISNLANKINKMHMADVYMEKAKEYEQVKLDKATKKKWKKAKKEEKIEPSEPGELTQEEFEAINMEIGSVTRKAREALRNKEYETAVELYQYASGLAFKINNPRKADIYSKRAKEILRKIEEE